MVGPAPGGRFVKRLGLLECGKRPIDVSVHRNVPRHRRYTRFHCFPINYKVRRMEQGNSWLSTIKPYASNLCAMFDGNWIEVTKSDIENSNGRKNKDDPVSKTSSCLYVAYQDDSVLYVGETSKSIRRRFIGDGSGCHRDKNAHWYDAMTKVRFVSFSNTELPTPYRKFLEQALAIHFNPLHYSRQLPENSQ